MTPHTLHLAQGLINGERVCLSRAITLIESLKQEHHDQAQYLLEYVLKKRQGDATQATQAKQTFRLGIAGPPGAGKSTFIEALGTMLVKELGYRVAVLAVDPSSSRTGGSILGDKTRMTELSKMENAYVRPSPTRGSLGGVAQHTNDVVLLCEAAAFEIIIVETVGLGQSEVLIDETVDMLMLLVPPAGGDELQGIKKGIMEIADVVVVNKSDGALEAAARNATTDFMHALQLMRRKHPTWRPRVKRCSALKQEKIEEVWAVVEKFRKRMTESGDLELKRKAQNSSWMWSQFQEQLVTRAKSDENIIKHGKQLEEELCRGFGTPRHAARLLVDELHVKLCY
eukprot:CAMPEP_0203795444 /NCGR_PEP_ID=MMETSP0100_2-20121128/7233_1 /ASSEMBLY_ACC=CAM_ASM_000210 /TAXON_ID=96639 /ORGANISM=" , Strain NY0313808BC1" /LENGTH=340 /DNA_ID=CAMNT_0050699953 /DNA_START=134 /DNA_END=1156 /DNA_ORIENTATION=+